MIVSLASSPAQLLFFFLAPQLLILFPISHLLLNSILFLFPIYFASLSWNFLSVWNNFPYLFTPLSPTSPPDNTPMVLRPLTAYCDLSLAPHMDCSPDAFHLSPSSLPPFPLTLPLSHSICADDTRLLTFYPVRKNYSFRTISPRFMLPSFIFFFFLCFSPALFDWINPSLFFLLHWVLEISPTLRAPVLFSHLSFFFLHSIFCPRKASPALPYQLDSSPLLLQLFKTLWLVSPQLPSLWIGIFFLLDSSEFCP